MLSLTQGQALDVTALAQAQMLPEDSIICMASLDTRQRARGPAERGRCQERAWSCAPPTRG